MKRFKLLSALFVGLIGLVSFGYCGKIVLTGTVDKPSVAANSTLFTLNLSNPNGNSGPISLSCSFPNHSSSSIRMDFVLTANGVNLNSWKKYWQTFDYSITNSNYFSLTVKNNTTTPNPYNFTYSCSVTADWIGVDTSCPTCPLQYTSEECQQEYSLMPINSCNSEYCGLNGLCPEYTGSTMSELYINGINHLGAPIINISIPLEQARDYNYTGDVMNINLSGGNNVDYEYMDNIIRTQNSKPNTTDLNNIVSVLLPKFVPGLVIILFILFIFRFLKKIF